MSYCISVDVGTSYTAAAIVRDGEAPQVLPLGLRAASIPSVIFLDADGTTVVGEAAERRGLDHPERVAREFKRRVGDSVPLVMGEVSVLAEDLHAMMVRHVVDRAEEREGEAPTSITLTHPAEWGGHRIASVRRAAAGVGITDVTLITEPEAAALSYASAQRVAPGSVVAVYDLGGGTFDATVLRKTDSESFAVLGTPSGLERLGGADFDQAVFAHVVESLPEVFAGLDPLSSETLPALARLRRECVEAKEALSTDSSVTLPVFLPGAYEQVRLVRSEFESMIEQDLRRTVDVLEAALADAEVEPRALSGILLIGGSSRIPLVAQLLSDRFERPLAVDADPKASIALGAAFAAAALTEEPAVADDDPVAAEAKPFVPVGGRSATPRHGPEAMTANRKLGMRISLLVGAVAAIGMATASAAGTSSPFAVLSSLAGGSVQEAEAVEPEDAAGATPVGDGDSEKEPSSTDGTADTGPLDGSPGEAAGSGAGTADAQPWGAEDAGTAFQGAGDPADRTQPSSSPRPDSPEASPSSPRTSPPDGSDTPSPSPTRSAPGDAAAISDAPVPATPAPTTPEPPTPDPTTPEPTTPAPTTPEPTTPAPTDPAPEAPTPTTPAPETPAPGASDGAPSGPPSEEPSSEAGAIQGGTDAPSEG